MEQQLLDTGYRNPEKPDTCLGCPLYKDGEGFCLGSGPIDSKMMFVGMAPGEDEVRAPHPRPLIGGSGRVFTKQTMMAGIQRDAAYITNIVKCRPHNLSNGENRDPTPEEIAYCSQYLKAELRASTANIIVALGTQALWALTGKSSIMKYRGVPIASGGRKVIGTIHPAAIMRQQELWPVVIFDLKRAKKESFFKEIEVGPVHYITDASDAHDGPVTLERARRLGYCAFDIETAGYNPKKPYQGALDARTSEIKCIGFGSEPGKAECYRGPGNRHAITSAILGDPSIEKIGQYSEGFDRPYCEDKGYPWAGKHFDIMQAFHLTNSDLPKDLGWISSFYADFPNWKDEKNRDLYEYNCKDVDATLRAYLSLRKELPRMGLADLFYNSVMPLQPRLRKMSRTGVKKNVPLADLWSSRIRRMCDEQESKLCQGLGFYINVQSPLQLMDLFYNKMGLPVQYTKDAKTRRMRPTCDKKAMERLAELTDNPIFHMINEIRKARQNCSTFIEVEHDENDFVHPHFGTAKAGTGRVNSEDPNGQNIPIYLREIYIPDSPEHIFIEVDWSQVEWRLQVVLSGDPVGLELLNSGLDNHRAVAAEILGKPYADITEDERFGAKFVVHGLGYGRSVKSIANQYRLSQEYVQSFVDRFAARFSVFWEERQKWVKQVGQHAYLANPFGRRRWWFSREVPEIYNFLAQSSAADMMYQVINASHDGCPGGWSLRMTVHDSLLACGPKSNVAEMWNYLQEHMRVKWPQITAASANPKLVEKYYPGGWFCQADATLGENWKQCKPKTKEDKQWQLDQMKYYGIKEAS